MFVNVTVFKKESQIYPNGKCEERLLVYVREVTKFELISLFESTVNRSAVCTQYWKVQ